MEDRQSCLSIVHRSSFIVPCSTFYVSPPRVEDRQSCLSILVFIITQSRNSDENGQAGLPVLHFSGRNPNDPPKPVSWGEATTDEMCIAFLGVTID